jgi:hypothetical protein
MLETLLSVDRRNRRAVMELDGLAWVERGYRDISGKPEPVRQCQMVVLLRAGILDQAGLRRVPEFAGLAVTKNHAAAGQAGITTRTSSRI